MSRGLYVLTRFLWDKSHFKTANYLTYIFNSISRIMCAGGTLQSAVNAACYLSATPCLIISQFTCHARTSQRLQVPKNSAQAVDYKTSDTFGRHRFDFRGTFFCGFRTSVRAKKKKRGGTVPLIRPWTPPYTSFHINYLPPIHHYTEWPTGLNQYTRLNKITRIQIIKFATLISKMGLEQRSTYSDSLRGGRFGVWTPVAVKYFLFSRPAMGLNQPPCTISTGSLSRGKAAWAWRCPSSAQPASRLRMSGAILLLRRCAFMACYWDSFTTTI